MGSPVKKDSSSNMNNLTNVTLFLMLVYKLGHFCLLSSVMWEAFA